MLVSIQSLILVSEPYFNEPGYERSRGTPSGNASSKEYDANIRQATVKWGMLEMLRNPVSCFRDVIQRHFWLKRREVIAEIEAWVIDLEDNCGDKRVGRTITHSCLALKVSLLNVGLVGWRAWLVLQHGQDLILLDCISVCAESVGRELVGGMVWHLYYMLSTCRIH